MKGESEKLKVVVLTNKDRKLLEGIHRSLEDIRKGRIKPFLEKELRNPKGHKEIIQKNPYKTIEYLCFASLLAKTIDSTSK